MLNLNSEKSSRVYLACGPTDLRKSIDGLACIVQMRFKLNPFSNSMFIFCNRNRDKIKILHWEHSSFWLYYKRLEEGKFNWPSKKGEIKDISLREFQWLLDGLSLKQPSAFKEIQDKNIV